MRSWLSFVSFVLSTKLRQLEYVAKRRKQLLFTPAFKAYGNRFAAFFQNGTMLDKEETLLSRDIPGHESLLEWTNGILVEKRPKASRPSSSKTLPTAAAYHYYKSRLPYRVPEFIRRNPRRRREYPMLREQEKGLYEVGNTSSGLRFLHKAQDFRQSVCYILDRHTEDRLPVPKGIRKRIIRGMKLLKPDSPYRGGWFSELSYAFRKTMSLTMSLKGMEELPRRGRPTTLIPAG
jgi:hypothetical protein